MTKTLITHHKTKIKQMDKTELQEFTIALSNTMVDKEAYDALIEAVEVRDIELNCDSAMAVSSEISYD